MIKIWGFIIICMVSFNSCVNDRSKNSFSWDQAQWIWHPDVASCATNRFTYFRNHFEYNGDYEIKAYFKADATARLYINGKIIRRKVTRYHPSKVRLEEIHLSKYLQQGENEILVLYHNWGDIKNFQRDEIRRAGMMFFAPDVLKLQSGWKAAKAKHSNDVSVITHTWLIKRLQQSYIKTTARAFWWTTP